MKINCKHCGYNTSSNGKIHLKNSYRLRFSCKSCLKITLTDDPGNILKARQPYQACNPIESQELLNIVNKWARLSQ